VQIAGNIARLHALVSYKLAAGVFFSAESKPGAYAGPYDNVQALSRLRTLQRRRNRRVQGVGIIPKKRRTEAPQPNVPETNSSAGFIVLPVSGYPAAFLKKPRPGKRLQPAVRLAASRIPGCG